MFVLGLADEFDDGSCREGTSRGGRGGRWCLEWAVGLIGLVGL